MRNLLDEYGKVTLDLEIYPPNTFYEYSPDGKILTSSMRSNVETAAIGVQTNRSFIARTKGLNRRQRRTLAQRKAKADKSKLLGSKGDADIGEQPGQTTPEKV